jgi:hypothetical protein
MKRNSTANTISQYGSTELNEDRNIKVSHTGFLLSTSRQNSLIIVRPASEAPITDKEKYF